MRRPEKWPRTGIPDNPGAWLMTTARNRALDEVRRHKMLRGKHQELARDMDDASAARAEAHEAQMERELDDDVGDDMLRLIFTACHPVLRPGGARRPDAADARRPDDAEIARAFLTPEPTIAQRIVRAKKTLGEAQRPVRGPARRRPRRPASPRCWRSST